MNNLTKYSRRTGVTRSLHTSSRRISFVTSMRSRVYATVRRPSVCLSRPAAERRCCGFTAVGQSVRRYRLLHGRRACGQQQQPRRSGVRWPDAVSATLLADVGRWILTCSKCSAFLTRCLSTESVRYYFLALCKAVTVWMRISGQTTNCEQHQAAVKPAACHTHYSPNP